MAALASLMAVISVGMAAPCQQTLHLASPTACHEARINAAYRPRTDSKFALQHKP